MNDDDGLEAAYGRYLPRHPNEPPRFLYCGVVEHVQGSVVVSGTSNADSDMRSIAQPLQPLRNLDDPADAAALERLRRDVVRTTHYVDYKWQEDDE